MAEANGTGAPQFGHSWEKAYIPVSGFLSASNCLAGYGRSQPRPTGISGQQFLGLPEERVPRVRPGEQSLLTSSPTRHQWKQVHAGSGRERGWAEVRPHGVRASPQPVGDEVTRLTSIGRGTLAVPGVPIPDAACRFLRSPIHERRGASWSAAALAAALVAGHADTVDVPVPLRWAEDQPSRRMEPAGSMGRSVSRRGGQKRQLTLPHSRTLPRQGRGIGSGCGQRVG